MFEAAFAGFRLGFGLILAIGGQNALVLRQGIRREHVFAVCLFCAVSDAILIAAGCFRGPRCPMSHPSETTVFRVGFA